MPDTDSSGSVSMPKEKKRTKNAHNNKINVICDSKVKGVEYKNWKGEIIPSRKTEDDCRLVHYNII